MTRIIWPLLHFYVVYFIVGLQSVHLLRRVVKTSLIVIDEVILVDLPWLFGVSSIRIWRQVFFWVLKLRLQRGHFFSFQLRFILWDRNSDVVAVNLGLMIVLVLMAIQILTLILLLLTELSLPLELLVVREMVFYLSMIIFDETIGLIIKTNIKLFFRIVRWLDYLLALASLFEKSTSFLINFYPGVVDVVGVTIGWVMKLTVGLSWSFTSVECGALVGFIQVWTLIQFLRTKIFAPTFRSTLAVITIMILRLWT